jgi:uncharacterized YccA/Bax inhibitor family protein
MRFAYLGALLLSLGGLALLDRRFRLAFWSDPRRTALALGIGVAAFLLWDVVGLVLGIFMLILDFDFVEQGIRNGLPERESWRAAFGMTVSLVWIYTNLLRLLAIFSDN